MITRMLRITIFHTNDMHGNLEGMARLSSLFQKLKQVEEASGRTVFFFDAGDAADRRISIVSSTKGAAFGPVMNAMGYQLQTLGNDLSLTYGPQSVPAYAVRLKFPLLAANLNGEDGQLYPGVTETALLPLPGGQQLGVIGLTPQAADVYVLFGIDMQEPTPRLREKVRELRDAGVGMVILLSHSGLREDRQFAETVPGIDVIIGGHSHDLLEKGEEVNGVLIAQAGDYAQHLGKVEIDLDAASGQIIRRSSSLIPVPEEELPAPAVLAAISAAQKEVEEINSQPVARLAEPFTLDYYQECPIGNFTADALLKRMHAEVAIVTTGLFHAGLPAGTITLGQLRQACFSTANPAVTELSGEQILEAMETGRTPENYEFMFKALRGAPIGIPQISGMQVWYNPLAPDGQRIQRVEIQGNPIDKQRSYRVAHTDIETYRYGCIHLREGQKSQFEMPTILNEVMLDALKASDPVLPPPSGRWIAVNG